MKHFLALALLAVSFSSQAVVVARLTNVECVSADGAQSIIIKYDSSKSIYGAQTFEINGNAVTSEIKIGHFYKVKAGDETYVFQTQDKKEFTTILQSKKTDLNEERAEASKFSLELGGEETEILCTVDTKFRLRE